MTTSAYAILAALRHAPDSTPNEISKIVGCAESTAYLMLRKFAVVGLANRRRENRGVLAYYGDGGVRRTPSGFVYRIRDGAAA